MVHEAGMLIQAMNEHVFGKELEEKIDDVRKDKGWDEFYLTFQQKPDLFMCNIIRNGWTASNVQPRPQSNTIQFYVNWKQGRVESRVFPPDSREGQGDIYHVPLIDGKQELNYSRKLG